ncbi:alpha/beta fold hydrolase [Virgisporangium aurantiacum]|uniref:Alpha/beta hydrolase n=1 Tax=Virgisporangium aurantiacum TaxID=175570 RepID=A0A8J3Z4J2_9ACTN|nr:alpha/beta hydrolase [Virgisporangium aurantiacum]GIJ56272.1 alpha/beta hydrolase [Virgisporangium aurantiacum]
MKPDPVVLLHGSGGGPHSWAGIVDRLADTYELFTPTRRGYGDTPTGSKTFRDEVDDVLALVEDLGRPVHLVGGSYGATVALHAAVAEPDAVRSLAVFEPPLYAAGPTIPLDRFRAALARDDTAAMVAVINDVTRAPASLTSGRTPDPAVFRRSATGWLHDLESMAADSTDITRWSAVSVPTLVMQGADTWEPMPTVMNTLAATIPGARRVIWPGQSHFATMTAPALFADTVRSFFGEAAT